MAVHDLDDAHLEAALRDAGRALAGAGRDLGPDVIAALRPATPVPRRRAVSRRLVPAVIVLMVLLAGAAVATGLIVPGIGLQVGGRQPPDPATPLVVDPAFLGTPTTLAAARDRVDFRVRVPAVAQLGPPQVYYADDPAGGRVSLLYPADERLPAMGDTPVGLFVTQFRGDVDEQLLTKVVDQGVEVTRVDIAGMPGWWIEGEHEVLYVDRTGNVTTEPSRFADSALLWTRDGVTLRLESALSRRQAIAIATSLR